VSRKTARSALAKDDSADAGAGPTGTAVDEVEPRIRERLWASATMPAAVVTERIGWTRFDPGVLVHVAESRWMFLPPDPASRPACNAGKIAQRRSQYSPSPDASDRASTGRTR
jgi:hypothetical protein